MNEIVNQIQEFKENTLIICTNKGAKLIEIKDNSQIIILKTILGSEYCIKSVIKLSDIKIALQS